MMIPAFSGNISESILSITQITVQTRLCGFAYRQRGRGGSEIDYGDCAEVAETVAAYNKVAPASGYSEAADFNCDGVDDIAGLLLLIANDNRQGES